MDLLTVVMHEFGHILGRENGGTGVMSETLTSGVRLAPALEPVEAADAVEADEPLLFAPDPGAGAIAVQPATESEEETNDDATGTREIVQLATGDNQNEDAEPATLLLAAPSLESETLWAAPEDGDDLPTLWASHVDGGY